MPHGVHDVFGISDERAAEIAKDVMNALNGAQQVSSLATKQLMETYDAESLLAGMRLVQAIQLNAKMQDYWNKKAADSPKEVQAFWQAFGPGRNAEQN